MSDKLKNAIQDKALYDNYLSFRQKVPFNIVHFIRTYLPQIDLIESDLKEKGISGFIKEEDDGKIYICVHKFDISNRKRFTIAHELGHYFLHKDEIKIGFVDGIGSSAMGRSDDWSAKEQEANDFAAEILMPEREFKEIYENFNGNLARVASFFIVSEAAAYTRAKLLKLLNKEDLTYFC